MAIRPDEIIKLRNEGMEYALRIARDQGIDVLAEEVKKRGYYRCTVKFTPEELNMSEQNISDRIYNNMLTIWYAVFRDKLGFGGKRLTQLKQWYDEKVYGVALKDDMGHHWARFEDYAREANEMFGLGIDLDRILETQGIQDERDIYDGTWIRADTAVERLKELGFEDAAEALRYEVYERK